jgi:16S rRNA (cytosine967-C5)-methyltransferase
VLEAAQAQPPMWLRVNRRAATPDRVLECLAAAWRGVAASDGAAIRLAEPVPVEALPGFRDGWVSVQDWGAQWAAPLLGIADGQRVLDACAAPGGKTCHLAELADIDLTAIDRDAVRLRRVESNLARLRLTATCRVADAARPGDWWDGAAFDRILLDVPCSASGVVRRHPDVKWIRRESDLAHFAAQQRELLAAAWPLLAPGGRLLYATCSIFAAENEDVVNAFIASQKGVRAVAPDPAMGCKLGENAAIAPPHPWVRLLPNHAHDGFFYALLEKSA